jgi:RNA 3'-terminal phosphate cyclase (ATP)
MTNANPIEIDGAMGEGGGQVLRSSLSLAAVTGQAVRIHRIRANRAKPGLMRQHLTAVLAAARVSNAEVEGATVGSTELTFTPGARVADDADAPPLHLELSVGTAGSTTLVLQTILPILLTSRAAAFVKIEGGTHNPMAPPFDFLVRSFLPLIARMGRAVDARLVRHGFYPAGGGVLEVRVPAKPTGGLLEPIEILERGEDRARRARALLVNLPRSIGEREVKVVCDRLRWRAEWCEVAVLGDTPGVGNVLHLEVESEALTEVVTAFGERGVTAEKVAERAVAEVKHYLAAGVPVGEHLVDQLLLPMALAGGGAFRTLALSRHAATNIEVIRAFLDVAIVVEADDRHTATVRIG